MTLTRTPFLGQLVFAVAAPLFIVVATAFLTIPFSLGGHPGEIRTTGVFSTAYHLS